MIDDIWDADDFSEAVENVRAAQELLGAVGYDTWRDLMAHGYYGYFRVVSVKTSERYL